MIASKQDRCARYVWARVTRYPYSTHAQLAGEQTDYSGNEISRAVVDLQMRGYIKRDEAYGGYVAVIPFVCQAPTWVR